MKTNIALIGFMGTGKSTIGEALAQRTGKCFVETDALIAQKAGKTIPQIFREDGEIAFRELEIEVIQEISNGKNQVIAGGGGVVLNWINIERLKQDAIIIWLIASPGTIVKRTGMNAEVRPVLHGMKDVKDIIALIKFRKPFYARAADIIINTSRLKTPQVVEEILTQLKLNANIHS